MIRLGLALLLLFMAAMAVLLVGLAHEADGRRCTVAPATPCHGDTP